jgi:hypothetical protein
LFASRDFSGLAAKSFVTRRGRIFCLGGVDGPRLPHSMAKARLTCGTHERGPAARRSARQTAHKGRLTHFMCGDVFYSCLLGRRGRVCVMRSRWPWLDQSPG